MDTVTVILNEYSRRTIWCNILTPERVQNFWFGPQCWIFDAPLAAKIRAWRRALPAAVLLRGAGFSRDASRLRSNVRFWHTQSIPLFNPRRLVPEKLKKEACEIFYDQNETRTYIAPPSLYFFTSTWCENLEAEQTSATYKRQILSNSVSIYFRRTRIIIISTWASNCWRVVYHSDTLQSRAKACGTHRSSTLPSKVNVPSMWDRRGELIPVV